MFLPPELEEGDRSATFIWGLLGRFCKKAASDLICEGKIIYILEVTGRTFQLKGTEA